ncbi:MAG: hypothetical protein GWP47_06565 [Actinobacteria bacterium]|jgi:hypothetical protein|nr:hypothetical protein [Actinomycetota bacterium]NCG36926.1 hypothetical protein [Actinomycetota bacterium]
MNTRTLLVNAAVSIPFLAFGGLVWPGGNPGFFAGAFVASLVLTVVTRPRK